MHEVLEKFDFDNTVSKLDEGGLLFQMLERFKNIDLHPDKIDNATMGTIFEELIRKFKEALKSTSSDCFYQYGLLNRNEQRSGERQSTGRSGPPVS